MKNIFIKLAVKQNFSQECRVIFAGKKRGSALLITLLMLGVLMTLTLGISNLVIREIRVTQSIIDANKAYYAAEAGVENALLGLHDSGPGFENQGQFLKAGGDCAGQTNCQVGEDDFAKLDAGFAYDYKINNTSDEVPGFDVDKPIFVETVASSDPDGLACQLSNSKNPSAIAKSKDQLYTDCPRATYKKLALNETNIIPLFKDDGSGGTVEAADFMVEYYLAFNDGSTFYGPFSGLDVKNFDVLRWKIYGKPKYSSDVQKTESIADFYPGVENNSATRPICIGTDGSLRSAGKETCIFPSLSKSTPASGTLTEEQENNLNDVTLWSAARECYQTDAGVGVTGGALIKGTTKGDLQGCQMKDFIDNHQQNYLILTNMVNPNVVGITDVKNPDQVARADIYYRIISRSEAAINADQSSSENIDNSVKSGSLVKDYAQISANGMVFKSDLTIPSVVKSLDVKYKAPGFLPVFNFSLYKVCSKGYDTDGLCKE